jgi:hypothetical protein
LIDIDIDQIRTRNFLPPASLEKPPRSSEDKGKGWNKRWPEVAIPFVIAVLPAAGQPLSAFGLRSLSYSEVCSSKAGGEKKYSLS